MCIHASVVEMCTCTDGCADSGRMKVSQILHHPAEPLAGFRTCIGWQWHLHKVDIGIQRHDPLMRTSVKAGDRLVTTSTGQADC